MTYPSPVLDYEPITKKIAEEMGVGSPISSIINDVNSDVTQKIDQCVRQLLVSGKLQRGDFFIICRFIPRYAGLDIAESAEVLPLPGMSKDEAVKVAVSCEEAARQSSVQLLQVDFEPETFIERTADMPTPMTINAGDPVTHDLWPDGERRIVQRVDDGSAYGHGWRIPIDELERVE